MSQESMFSGTSLAASVALAMMACGGPEAKAPVGETTMTSGTVQCKESNSCKGNGSCAGVAVKEKHSCKGQNACGGNLRTITKSECDALKGTVVASQ
jgi:hypothetical protein